MDYSNKRVAIFVCFLNAGISTKGIEIAKALRKVAPGLVIKFFSWKGPESMTYDFVAEDAGFDVSHYGTPIDREMWATLLEKEHKGEGFRDKEFLVANIQGAIKAIEEFAPHVIVHGAVPMDACIAARIVGVPNILYVPLPFWDREWLLSHVFTDIPDSQSSWITDLLPRWVRQQMIHQMYRRRKSTNSPSYQAAIECGWNPDDDAEEGQLYHANEYIVFDLPANYESVTLDRNVHVVGPLHARTTNQDLPENVKSLLQWNGKKVFVTMGSTGYKEYLLEVIEALRRKTYLCAVVTLIPSRCTLQDIREALQGEEGLSHRILLTETFLPAALVAKEVDVMVGHGGAGTVHTALSCGTPIVGVAMQWEQQFLLDSASKWGAAIRIPKRQWKAKSILEAIETILSDKSYKNAAKQIQDQVSPEQSANEAARIVLNTIK
jgi:UDP:flavonoid glycosyltransferase YjiC (YdhE family)